MDSWTQHFPTIWQSDITLTNRWTVGHSTDQPLDCWTQQCPTIAQFDTAQSYHWIDGHSISTSTSKIGSRKYWAPARYKVNEILYTSNMLGQGKIGHQQDGVRERLDTCKMGSRKDWTPAGWGQGKIGYQHMGSRKYWTQPICGVKERLDTSKIQGQGNIGHKQYARSRKECKPAIRGADNLKLLEQTRFSIQNCTTKSG